MNVTRVMTVGELEEALSRMQPDARLDLVHHPDGLHVQLRMGATVVTTFPYLWGAAQYKEYLDHSETDTPR